MQISETRTHPHTNDKNKLKMAERLKYKTRHHQTPRREHRQNIHINLANVFSGQSPKASVSQKEKDKCHMISLISGI